jgi:glycogen synthase
MGGALEALKLYKDAAKWKTVVRRALAKDFSWQNTAAEYLKAYRRVTRRVKARASA